MTPGGSTGTATGTVLSIISVNFNSGYRLAQCLESLFKHPPTCPFEVIVVDNGSTDTSLESVPPSLLDGRVEILRNAANLGYTAAANRGFAKAQGEFVLMLNPDMIVHEGSIDAMLRHMHEDASIGGIGGYGLDASGRFEKYVNRLPTPWVVYCTQFRPRHKVERLPAYRSYHMLDDDFDNALEAPQPAGGCIMVRRALFGGELMSPTFGIYFSDVEVAQKIYNAGKRVMIFPDAKFTHDHDRTGKPDPDFGLVLELDYYVGCAHFFRKYGTLGQWLAVKVLFATRLLMRLLTVEWLDVVRGRQPASRLPKRVGLLWDFLRGHNRFVVRVTR